MTSHLYSSKGSLFNYTQFRDNLIRQNRLSCLLRESSAMAPERIALRRHAKTCCGLTSCARATAETFAPGVIASSSIRALASSDHRRRGTPGLASSRAGTASMTAKVPCLDLGADCKPTSRENHHESVAPFTGRRNTGSGGRLRKNRDWTSSASGQILKAAGVLSMC